MLQHTPIYPAVVFQENGEYIGAIPSVQSVQLGRVCCNPLELLKKKEWRSAQGPVSPVSCRTVHFGALRISKYEDHVNCF